LALLWAACVLLRWLSKSARVQVINFDLAQNRVEGTDSRLHFPSYQLVFGGPDASTELSYRIKNYDNERKNRIAYAIS
jgi:hypothetical protein